MSALFVAVYGVAAYAAGLVALLYFIGFSGNLLVPRSVDVGAGGPWLENLAVDLLLLALFGIQHSVMARRGFKRWWTRIVLPAAERSTYLVATCAVLALMFVFWRPITTPVVWRVESDAGTLILWTVFGLGWLTVLVSTFLIDHFELFGLKQVYANLVGRDLAEPGFRTPWLYRYVRHPLYAGLLATFWAVPEMTAGRLLFALGFTAYILIGVAYEERDLVERFGDAYRRYRAEVGMLLPWSGRA